MVVELSVGGLMNIDSFLSQKSSNSLTGDDIKLSERLSIPGSKLRVFLLKIFGSKIGTNVYLKPKINIKFPWKLKIGDNSWVGEEVWIDNISEVEIGKNCCISQGVYLCTGNHDFSKESFDLMSENILIEDSVWIGAKSIIGPGSKISKGKFIKLGEIYTKKNN